MSKVLGIIAEYNPMHNGHIYHLKESKKQTGAEETVLVMSGNFTQRGIPSIIDKYEKAKIAIENGIDLVIELPCIYSISSAENFASGSIKILNSLGIIDYLSFGAESNIENLENIANILVDEKYEYKKYLEAELDLGNSYPKARENALAKYLKSDNMNIISMPNNILAIEYLKSLKKINSKIKPIAIKRNYVESNSDKINKNYASSSLIRKLIKENRIEKIKDFVPINTFNALKSNIENGHFIFGLKSFEKEIMYELRKMSIEEINSLPDVNEGLGNLLKKANNKCNNLEELISIVKTKRYTLTRIQRILLYALLGITKEEMEISKEINPYVRVLGFSKKGEKILSQIKKKNNNVKIITSVNKFLESNEDKALKEMLKRDILASNIYTLGFEKEPFANKDFTSRLIV